MVSGYHFANTTICTHRVSLFQGGFTTISSTGPWKRGRFVMPPVALLGLELLITVKLMPMFGVCVCVPLYMEINDHMEGNKRIRGTENEGEEKMWCIRLEVKEGK